MVHVVRGQAQGLSDIGNHLGIEYYIFFLYSIALRLVLRVSNIQNRSKPISKYMYIHIRRKL